MSKKVRIDETQRARKGSAVTVDIKADPLEIEVDATELIAAPAEAMARSIARGIRAAGPAAERTLRQRRSKGIGDTRRWNATGKLAGSITAQRDGKSYAIVAADDRLQRDELGELLADDVPQLGELAPEVDAAIAAAADAMVTTKRR